MKINFGSIFILKNSKKSATDYSSGIAVHDMILTLSTGSVDKQMLSPNILHARIYEI